MIESSMISFGKGDDEFTGSLVASVDPHSGFGQPLGIHESNELKQEIWLSFKKIRGFAFDGGLELFGVVSWNSIPGLGLPPMHCK